MNRSAFVKMCQAMFDEEMKIQGSKGKEYSGDEDVVANFKRLAEGLSTLERPITPEVILWVYVSKHLDAVRSFIQTGKYYSNESILDRIKDVRVYMSLLRALVCDKPKVLVKEKPKPGLAVGTTGPRYKCVDGK